MSYLSRPRLNFVGRFEADVSTVNNDVLHFDGSKFTPADTQQTGDGTKGWWNPRGTGSWRIFDARVTGAVLDDGSAPAADDPIFSMKIEDGGDRVSAKIVDLDPQQQMASQIWGLTMRVTLGGQVMVSGKFAMAPFTDLYQRVSGGPAAGDFGMSALYQSELTDVVWGDVGKSTALSKLRAISASSLSVRFVLDGYSMNFTRPEFGTGRIVGTIGPCGGDDPKRFVRGRHIYGIDFATAPGVPTFNVSAAQLEGNLLSVDLANGFPFAAWSGSPSDIGSLAIALDGSATILTPIEYGTDGWYENSGGIVDLQLTDAHAAAAAKTALTIVKTSDVKPVVIAAESPDGVHVRADQFVYRIDSGSSASVDLYATRFGLPAIGLAIQCSLDDSGLPQGNGPAVNQPTAALHFPTSVTTDARGHAELLITAADPGNPRGFIDGQVYGVRYAADKMLINPYDFVSVLVFDGVPAIEDPAWWDVAPILSLFANLYPIMRRVVDLSSYDDVVAKRNLLERVFTLPIDDPNYMPVTRDLSNAKRQLLLKWLRTDGANGLPEKGAPPPARVLAVPESDQEPDDPNAALGGKTAARAKTPQFRGREETQR